jgi:type IV secretory pathway VirB10-like protein
MGSGEPAVLDRRLSEAVRSAPRPKAWMLAAGGAGLVALLVLLQAPRSESRDVGLTERSRVARGKAPRVDVFPEVEPAAEPASEGEAAPASALAQELAMDLQRQALQDVEARRRRAAERQRSPIVLFDEATPRNPSALGAERRAGGTARRDEAPRGLDLLTPPRTDEDGGREERFARRAALEVVETVRAERVENPSTLVPQGTFIQGVLETEIQSDLPGMIRAQVSAPVRAFDGSLVIPAGSRLIGRYQSGLVCGQTRVFVIWTRLLRPDGVSMRIDSPGADALGRAGVSGEVDTHFFEIFGSSILLSLLDGGLDVAASSVREGRGTVIQNGGGDLNRAAEIALQNRIAVAPTIRVPRGTPIQVVVSKDLDFAGTDPRMD